MRRVIAPLVLLAVLMTGSACDGGSAVDDLESGLDGSSTETVPPCPFDAQKISALVGQTLVKLDDGSNCSFGDDRGVANVTVNPATKTAGALTYDYQRQRADDVYDVVKDVNLGEKAYIAAKPPNAEAQVVSDKGSYLVMMSSFEFDLAGYEQALRKILDAIFA